MTEVVDELLNACEGDLFQLEAEYYEFKSPFEVVDVEELEWTAATESKWQSRRVDLESKPKGRGRKSTRTLEIYSDGPAPTWGSYGELIDVQPIDPDCTGDSDDETGLEWLQRPADEVVESTVGLRRDLEEVLDVVESAETVIDVHNRIRPDTLSKTKTLLWELGLRDGEIDTKLLEDPERQERIDAIREVFVDDD